MMSQLSADSDRQFHQFQESDTAGIVVPMPSLDRGLLLGAALKTQGLFVPHQQLENDEMPRHDFNRLVVFGRSVTPPSSYDFAPFIEEVTADPIKEIFRKALMVESPDNVNITAVQINRMRPGQFAELHSHPDAELVATALLQPAEQGGIHRTARTWTAAASHPDTPNLDSSNFMVCTGKRPHEVTPVTQGERFSVIWTVR